jgi:hypothetical protein
MWKNRAQTHCVYLHIDVYLYTTWARRRMEEEGRLDVCLLLMYRTNDENIVILNKFIINFIQKWTINFDCLTIYLLYAFLMLPERIQIFRHSTCSLRHIYIHNRIWFIFLFIFLMPFCLPFIPHFTLFSFYLCLLALNDFFLCFHIS